MIDVVVLDSILKFGPVFLLIAVRALAIIETAPVISSGAVPQVAKIALAGFVAFISLPTASAFSGGVGAAYPQSLGWEAADSMRYEPFSFRFLLLLMGEAVIGIIIGFFITIVFSAFSTAGQFFSLQMGFGASETFDPLSQIENPLMGQYLNLVAMLVFINIGGFHQLFLGGFWRSVQSLNVISLVEGSESVIKMIAAGLPRLFMNAIVISLPIIGTLFLTSLITGLISKAAPQINILSEGFPISVTVAFLVIYSSLPFMTEAFSRIIMNEGFGGIEAIFIKIGHQIEGGRL